MAYKRGDPLVKKNPLFRFASHIVFFFVFLIGYPLYEVMYRLKVKGRWRIAEFLKTDKNKKAITVSNHTNFLDAILACIPFLPMRIHLTLLEETVCTPFLGTFIQSLGGVPVPRGRDGLTRFIEGIQEALEIYHFIHIYPEGECYIYNQNVQEFHRGAFYIAKKLDLPVMPIATVFKEPKSILGWKSVRPRVESHVLAPVYPDQFKTDKEFAAYVQNLIQSEIDKSGGTNRFCKGHMERIKGINDK